MALNKISDITTKVFPWREIRNAIEQKSGCSLEHFVGSTSSIFVSELGKKYDRITAIFPDFDSAQFLKSDLDELEADNTLLFPPTNHKPYDDQQILDRSLMVRRSEVLDQIQKNNRFITVTSAGALFDKIASPQIFKEASFTISTGEEIEPEKIRELLLDQQYSRVKFVDEPGEFASRGGILDIFPYSGEYPIRLEFFGDEIDSIREFDPDSQRSVAYRDTVRVVPDATNLDTGEKTPQVRNQARREEELRADGEIRRPEHPLQLDHRAVQKRQLGAAGWAIKGLLDRIP